MSKRLLFHTPKAPVLLKALLFLCFWTALWAALREAPWALLLAVAVHEAGHYLAAKLMKERVSLFSIFLGEGLEAQGFLSPGKEALTALGGPLANRSAWCFFLIFGQGGSPFAQSQLLMALFNLLPFCGYYRLSRALAVLGQAAALLWLFLLVVSASGRLLYLAPVFLFILSSGEKNKPYTLIFAVFITKMQKSSQNKEVYG